MDQEKIRLPIQYSCYFTRSREGEQFVPDHVIGYVITGSLSLTDGKRTVAYGPGDSYYIGRNQLLKFMKTPGEQQEFRSVSIYLTQEVLRKFSLVHGYAAENNHEAPSFMSLTPYRQFVAFMQSLLAYEGILSNGNSPDLVKVKQSEALLLLLQIVPSLRSQLFDFTDPGKIDLEAFMKKNYHFNVELKRFAYLTGRSLSTFKRDFEKIFHTTPSRWLLQRRLEEAHYLIKEKKKAVSDVYLDLGFEDLSHFSFAFKKLYGVAPSLLN